MIYYSIGDRELSFTTDNGVFSKDGVDFGSNLLIKTAISEGYSGKTLDLGCGYGPVGISLYTHNPDIELVMADINQRAVELCRKNVALNISLKDVYYGAPESRGDDKNNNGVEVICSDGFSGIRQSEGGLRYFNYIFLNPPIRAGKTVVFRLYNECLDNLEVGGHLYVVIQKKHGMSSSFKELQRLFGNCAKIAKKSGYFVLLSLKDIEISAHEQQAITSA
ncbi:MAG: methyltransferase [Oscillospiraceae bacterium]|nr:methyltransferase [Oscillospiraceae bacterium]